MKARKRSRSHPNTDCESRPAGKDNRKLAVFRHCYFRFGLSARYCCIMLMFSVFFLPPSKAQDVGNGYNQLRNFRDQTLGINGGLSITSNLYTSSGIEPRRDRFQWLVNMNTNLSFMGINAPFAFSFSDGNQQFNLPSYTFTGISPTYKWATLHLGDRNMLFSKYTLSNINFRGAGVELTPGKWRVSAMTGRLRRAVAEDLNSRQMLDPAYARKGWGVKVGYGDRDFFMDLILFGAQDDPNSISTPTVFDVLPSENVVVGLKGAKTLFKRVALDFDLARSALNQDRRLDENPGNFSGLQSTILGLFQPNESAIFGNASNIGLSYRANSYQLRLARERIDRGFKTLGSLFFNSDIENYTGQITSKLFKNKLALGLNGGIQRSNIDDREKTSSDRVIGAVSLAYTPQERWYFSTSYSNFENTTKLRAQDDPLSPVDSIFLAQLTQSASFVTNYQIHQEFNPSSISFMFNYQTANSIENDIVVEDAKSKFYNAMLSYNHKWDLPALNFTSSVSLNQSDFAFVSTRTFSTTVGLQKSFSQNKVQAGIRTTFSNITMDASGADRVLSLGLNGNFQLPYNQGLSASLNILRRAGNIADRPSFTELYGDIRYTYQFTTQARIFKNKTDQNPNDE